MRKLIMIVRTHRCKQNIIEQIMLAVSPNQIGHLGCIPLQVHYIFCLFNTHVKTMQE